MSSLTIQYIKLYIRRVALKVMNKSWDSKGLTPHLMQTTYYLVVMMLTIPFKFSFQKKKKNYFYTHPPLKIVSHTGPTNTDG